jgi:hypothetical protein
MMNRLAQISILILASLLVISLGGNLIQHNRCKDPIVETVTVRDTVSRVDTIIKVVTNRIVIEKPVPISVDTTQNIRIYRDTIYHQYGQIRREEIVSGELVKKDIEFDLQIPEITRTLTVNNTVTRTVRSPLLFVTGGVRSTVTNQGYVPTIGLFGVSEGHKWSAGVEYGFDRQLTMKIGFSIYK